MVVVTYGEGARGVARRCPAPAPVQAEALVLDDLEHAAAPEGLGVGLALDLEHVEGQEDDLADADQASRRRVHDGLARLLAKRILKVFAVVCPEVVARHRLAAVLVYPLEDLDCRTTNAHRSANPPSFSLSLSLCVYFFC